MYKLLLFTGVLFNVFAQIILKKAMTGFNILQQDQSLIIKLKTMVFNPLFISAIGLYGIGFVIYSIVLSKIELSKAYPVASVGAIIFVFIFSIVFLSESITTMKLIGMGLCIAGILLIL